MARQRPSILPKHARLLINLSENIRLARRRRKLSATMVAERAGISRSTLHLLESGEGNTSIAVMLQVLVVLGLSDDLKEVAKDDELGRKLQDLAIRKPTRRVRKSAAIADDEATSVAGDSVNESST